MPKAIGIDLGTTNSAMAVMEGGEPVVIPSAEGGRNPHNTIFSIKRIMGRRFDDPVVQRDVKILPYKMDAADNGDARVWMGERSYSPPETSAMILHKLKADAEAYLGDTVNEAGITVPPVFNASQR